MAAVIQATRGSHRHTADKEQTSNEELPATTGPPTSREQEENTTQESQREVQGQNATIGITDCNNRDHHAVDSLTSTSWENHRHVGKRITYLFF